MAEGGGGGNKDELEPDEGQDDLAWFEEDEDEQEEEEENEEDEQLLLSSCRCQDAGAGRGSSASTCTSTAVSLGQDTTSVVDATERRGHRDHGGSGGASPWRFSFSTAACAMCDGYYGPNFGQHVCTTCHLFLYPDDINLPVEANNFSQQKTDDDDSGNDEPSDLPSVLDLMAEQQHQQQPQEQEPVEVEAAHDDGRDEEEEDEEQEVEEVEDQQQSESDGGEEMGGGEVAEARGEGGEGQPPALDPERNLPLPLYRWHQQQPKMVHDDGDDDDDNESEAAAAAEESRDRLRSLHMAHCNNNNNDNSNFSKRLQQLLQQQQGLHAAQPPPTAAAAIVDRLAEQLSLLSTPRPSQESVTASRVVQSLPPELLMHVFSHLDDISLWSASRVCLRWASIIHQSVSNEQWSKFTLRRWPLFRPNYSVGVGSGSGGWASVFGQLVDSSPCLYCLHRSSVEEEGANWEPSNHWRNNRLCNEWRMFCTDPPEGIRATPLDRAWSHWQASITGPTGSPYEGGVFYLHVQIPHSYPIRPPLVRFATRILHPNVSRHGDVGLDSLGYNWSLALTIAKVLISVQSLLTDPYCTVAMEPRVAQLYTQHRARFNAVARSWTSKYAMNDVRRPPTQQQQQQQSLSKTSGSSKSKSSSSSPSFSSSSNSNNTHPPPPPPPSGSSGGCGSGGGCLLLR